MYNFIKNNQLGFKGSLLIILMCFVSLGCDYSFPEPEVEEKGKINDADISKSVFIGSTLFSGLQNGALTTRSIENSVPNIFLNQINETQITEANFSPKVSSENGFNIFENQSLNSNIGQYRLFYPTADTADFMRTTTIGEPFSFVNSNSELNNYSFPKSQILDITEAGRNTNPFVNSFFGNTNTPIINTITNQDPSFFVLNLGYDDILAYAINGAEGSPNQNAPGSHTFGDLIDESLFESKLNEVINAFYTANPDSKGVLMNIPNFLNFPYFIEVGFDITPYVLNTPLYNRIVQKANIYNSALENYYNQNPNIQYSDRRPYLDFADDIKYKWGILVTDRELNSATGFSNEELPKIRHAARGEKVFMSVESKLNKTKGHFPENALLESEYLKKSEVEFISNKIQSFNQILSNTVAQSNGRIKLLDMNSYFESLFEGLDIFLNKRADGTVVDGVLFYPGIEKNGIFSADGLTLNDRGNALIANELIKLINDGFSGNIPLINVNSFAGTQIYLSNN